MSSSRSRSRARAVRRGASSGFQLPPASLHEMPHSLAPLAPLPSFVRSPASRPSPSSLAQDGEDDGGSARRNGQEGPVLCLLWLSLGHCCQSPRESACPEECLLLRGKVGGRGPSLRSPLRSPVAIREDILGHGPRRAGGRMMGSREMNELVGPTALLRSQQHGRLGPLGLSCLGIHFL